MKKKDNFSILTPKDVLILKKLLEDGRKSSSSISKEIDLGREIVNYRIKRLIKENLIVKFIPKVNEEALNYKEYIILLKLNLNDEISRERFVKEQIGNKYLVWIVKSASGWDLVIRLYAQSIAEFKDKLNEILESYSSVLAKYYTIIATDEIKASEKELISKQVFNEDFTKNNFKVVKKQDPVELDEKNKEILHLLEGDARIQYKEIAQQLDISSDTVKYRIDKMKSEGIIENFLPVLNYNKLGLIQYAGILKFYYLTKDEEKQVCDTIKECKCVVKAIKNLNSEEFFLTLVFSQDDEVEEFKNIINSSFEEKIENIELFRID